MRVTVSFPDPTTGPGREDDGATRRLRRLDVDVDDGLPVGLLRLHLVRTTGWAGWAVAALTADGVPVDDAHPAGVPPLCHGTLLHPGPAARPVAARAAAAPWHLAVTAGPDAGALLVPAGRGPWRVGPNQPLAVRDPQWDRPLLVREAGGSALRRRLGSLWSRLPSRAPRAPAAPRVLVRVGRGLPTPSALAPGQRTGPVLVAGVRRGPRPGRATRALPTRRWVRWRPADEARIGSTVVVLRTDGAAACARRLGGRAATGPTDRRTTLLRLAAPVTSVLTGVLLAATLHQPVLLLTGLVSAPMLLLGARRTAEPAHAGGAASAPGTAGPSGGAEARAGGHGVDGGHRGAGGHGGPGGPQAAAPSRADPSDLPALRLATVASRWHPESEPPADVPVAWGPGGCLAVVGERGAVLAAARGLLLGALGTHARPTVALLTGGPQDWRWLVWGRPCNTGLPGADDRPALVIVDDPVGGVPEAVARWYATASSRHHVLWLAPDEGRVPAWCRGVLHVTATSARRRDGDGPWRPTPLVAVHPDVAEDQLRWCAGGPLPAPAIAGSPAPVAVPGLDACPAGAVLGALPGVPPPDVRAVLRAWNRPEPGLPLPLGRGPAGAAVLLDLVRDGPHALVAGTTGAGKSELLTTVVLGMALCRPPERLAVLLVDFKGGTGLPVVADLPHVVGHLSDLDAAGARRALRGLSAELRRREALLAAVGARDLAELDPHSPGTPPRLLVVVDEFRALVDDLPELVPGLGRLAAQGRSLGVHLVLATQRPAGAVQADLRANVALRIALRVADAVDSQDVVDVPDAVRIPADRPGLAVLRGAAGPPRAVQVARAAPRPTTPPVRWAPPAEALLGAGRRPWAPRPSPDAPGDARAWADVLRAAAAGRPAPAGPWLPELPGRVRVADVPAGDGLPLAVSDLPDELRRGGVRWDPDAGHLLVLGGPGSGRTTTLRAVAQAAARTGRGVHAVGLPAGLAVGVGTTLAGDDVTRIARLIRLLTDERPAGRDAASRTPAGRARHGAPQRPLLVIDDVEAVLAELGALARGAAADLLAACWTTAGAPVAVVASTGVGAATGRLLAGFADRLVLGAPDPSADVLAGVPPALAGPRPQPGRAVHVGRQGAALCQVALPDDTDRPAPVSGRRVVVPLLDRASRPDHARPRRTALGGLEVPVGLGGDLGEPCWVDVGRGLLVVGPPGAGRTTALRAASAGLSEAGCRVASAAGDGPAADELAERALDLLRATAPDAGRAGVAPNPASGSAGTVVPRDPPGPLPGGAPPATPSGAPLVLVVDDLDELEARRPDLAEALVEALGRPGGAVVVLAATTTAHAVAAFRGPAAALVRARRLLVLDLAEPGSVDLLGPQGAWLVDPRRRPVGRGALRCGRDVSPVQVWAPPAPMPPRPDPR